MAKKGIVCGACGHKHFATDEGWVAPHHSKRTGKRCSGSERHNEEAPSSSPFPKDEGFSDDEYSTSVRTVSGGLPGLGRRE